MPNHIMELVGAAALFALAGVFKFMHCFCWSDSNNAGPQQASRMLDVLMALCIIGGILMLLHACGVTL